MIDHAPVELAVVGHVHRGPGRPWSAWRHGPSVDLRAGAVVPVTEVVAVARVEPSAGAVMFSGSDGRPAVT